jgi:hypothetical protein
MRIADGWEELTTAKSATAADLTQREALSVLADVHAKEVGEQIGRAIPLPKGMGARWLHCGGEAKIPAEAERILRDEDRRDARERAGLPAGAEDAADEETAYHEAGHAVVCYMLGDRIDKVYIDPDEEGRAALVATPPRCEPGDRPLAVENRIMVCLAGELAATKATGKEWHGGAGGDREQIGDARFRLAWFDGPCAWSQATKLRFVGWLRALTQDLLDAPEVWQAVKALALELLRNRVLSGPEATALISPHVRVWKTRVPLTRPEP